MNKNDESVENNNPAVSSLLRELTEINPSDSFNQRLFSELQLNDISPKKNRIISLYSSRTFIGSAAASLFVLITSYFVWQGLNNETASDVISTPSSARPTTNETVNSGVLVQENQKKDESTVQNVSKAGRSSAGGLSEVKGETEIQEVTLPEAVVSAPLKEEATSTMTQPELNSVVQSKAMSRNVILPKTAKDSSKLKDSLKIRKKTD